jgi:RNA polymerase sigma-70 factor (ECF subfamily)
MQLYMSRKRIFAIAALAVGKTIRLVTGEEELIRRSQAGDRKAFEGLIKVYSGHLRRFVSRKVIEADREDLLQDTWLAAWEGLKGFDPSTNFRLWLYSICYHKIQDHWRRKRTRGAPVQLDAEEPAGLYMPAEFGRVELRECLQTFFAACSPEQLEMLRQYYALGFTLKEIAECSGRNLNTVKYQFYRLHELAAAHLPADPETLLTKVVVA